jgi:undecaprenyl diphosphate synthase
LASEKRDKIVQERIKRTGNLPVHIAIITDGNGRWAKERGLSRTRGHQAGIDTVREIVEVCGQIGIKYLTLYTFSTENWKRPKDEVSILMKILLRAFKKETDKLNKNNVRLTVIGEISSLPEKVQIELNESVEKLKNNNGLTLNLALSYSGRWDILQGVKKIMQELKQNRITSEDITVEKFSSFLATKDIPDPDLLIRTSGENRLSNFLLWQIAYTELYISPLYWPDFKREHLYKAISDYQKRERRFGMVSEQLKKN